MLYFCRATVLVAAWQLSSNDFVLKDNVQRRVLVADAKKCWNHMIQPRTWMCFSVAFCPHNKAWIQCHHNNKQTKRDPCSSPQQCSCRVRGSVSSSSDSTHNWGNVLLGTGGKYVTCSIIFSHFEPRTHLKLYTLVERGDWQISNCIFFLFIYCDYQASNSMFHYVSSVSNDVFEKILFKVIQVNTVE